MSHLPTLGDCSEISKFPSSVAHHLRANRPNELGGERLIKGYFSSNDRAVLFRGRNLEVVDPKNNERVSAWTFGKDDSDPSEITCSASLGPESSKVVIGVDRSVAGEGGMICLLDTKISKITKAVKIPHRVTCMVVISNVGGSKSNSRSFAEELMFFHGILAIGTQEGHIYLLDLCLDDERVSDESKPLTLQIFDPRKGDLGQQRNRAKSTDQVICISLNANSYSMTIFHYEDSKGTVVDFPENGVVVSAISYVSQLGSIVVGYNFGSWQIWSLNSLLAEYGSQYKSSTLPVIDTCFQEPENDPRNYCYIWIMRGENDLDSQGEKGSLSTFSNLELYSLNYENRDEVDQYGVLYNGLQSISKRFEYTLSGNPQSEYKPIGSIGISSFALGSLAANRCQQLEIRENDLDGINTQGLCIFLWEVRLAHSSEGEYFMGIFDINMWYQDQMPSYVEPVTGVQCSYLCFCNMDDILESCPGANVVNLCVDLSSLSRCKSISKSERNFYPSSLTFEMTVLLDEGFIEASHLGLQRKVLLELQSQGANSLVEPYHYYNVCCIAGLINDSKIEIDSEQEQRSALLTVALENHIVNLLTNCVSVWSDGKYAEEGCTLKFLLDWSWERVAVIKQNIDKMTIPLFDYSSLQFDEETQKSLLKSSQNLHHLCAVICGLIRTCGDSEELTIKMNVARLVNLYLKVILWFFTSGLLPEIPETSSDFLESRGQQSPFPYSDLVAWYRKRRKDLQSHHDRLDFENVPVLLIDGLCKQLGPKLQFNFQRDNGDGFYPPPTLRALLCSYLIDESSVQDMDKHRITHYLFLDLSNRMCDEEKWSTMIDRLIQFPSAFSMPPSVIKLTQAFWLLDQGDFEEALGMLLDPLIKENEISPWQHQAIVVAFLTQGQAKLALKYTRIRHPPVRDILDIKLQISILISTNNIDEAFQFQRARKTNSKDLLCFFFGQAEKLGKLELIFELTLTMFEEKEFVAFLKDSESSSDVLLMFYLQRYRFQEALEYHALLKKRNKSTTTHQAIMGRYAHLLPNLLLKQDPKRDHLKINRESTMAPVPLSLEVKTSNYDPMIHTSIIEESIENEHNQSCFTPFRPKGQRNVDVLKRRFKEVESSPTLNDSMSAPKRGRFQEIEEEPSVSTNQSINFLEAEVASVLSTPVISRQTLPQTVSELNQNKLAPILKGDLEFSSISKNSIFGDIKDSPSNKSLRFNVSTKLPPPELVPVNLQAENESSRSSSEVVEVDSVEATGGLQVSLEYSSKKPSPRRPLADYADEEKAESEVEILDDDSDEETESKQEDEESASDVVEIESDKDEETEIEGSLEYEDVIIDEEEEESHPQDEKCSHQTDEIMSIENDQTEEEEESPHLILEDSEEPTEISETNPPKSPSLSLRDTFQSSIAKESLDESKWIKDLAYKEANKLEITRAECLDTKIVAAEESIGVSINSSKTVEDWLKLTAFNNAKDSSLKFNETAEVSSVLPKDSFQVPITPEVPIRKKPVFQFDLSKYNEDEDQDEDLLSSDESDEENDTQKNESTERDNETFTFSKAEVVDYEDDKEVTFKFSNASNVENSEKIEEEEEINDDVDKPVFNFSQELEVVDSDEEVTFSFPTPKQISEEYGTNVLETSIPIPQQIEVSTVETSVSPAHVQEKVITEKSADVVDTQSSNELQSITESNDTIRNHSDSPIKPESPEEVKTPAKEAQSVQTPSLRRSPRFSKTSPQIISPKRSTRSTMSEDRELNTPTKPRSRVVQSAEREIDKSVSVSSAQKSSRISTPIRRSRRLSGKTDIETNVTMTSSKLNIIDEEEQPVEESVEVFNSTEVTIGAPVPCPNESAILEKRKSKITSKKETVADVSLRRSGRVSNRGGSENIVVSKRKIFPMNQTFDTNTDPALLLANESGRISTRKSVDSRRNLKVSSPSEVSQISDVDKSKKEIVKMTPSRRSKRISQNATVNESKFEESILRKEVSHRASRRVSKLTSTICVSPNKTSVPDEISINCSPIPDQSTLIRKIEEKTVLEEKSKEVESPKNTTRKSKRISFAASVPPEISLETSSFPENETIAKQELSVEEIPELSLDVSAFPENQTPETSTVEANVQTESSKVRKSLRISNQSSKADSEEVEEEDVPEISLEVSSFPDLPGDETVRRSRRISSKFEEIESSKASTSYKPSPRTRRRMTNLGDLNITRKSVLPTTKVVDGKEVMVYPVEKRRRISRKASEASNCFTLAKKDNIKVPVTLSESDTVESPPLPPRTRRRYTVGKKPVLAKMKYF